MPTYFVVEYDNEASGPFVAEGADLTWDAAASSGTIITVIDRGTTGKLYCALLTGTIPNDNDAMTQGTTTADAFKDGQAILYPAYFREDLAVPSTGITSWTGPALGTTHSFFFSGQTVNVVAGEILTFSGGQTCEVITVESDAGATGELSVRFISNLDAGLPVDGDTFTGDIAGDGTVDGVVHDRAYSPLHIHRLLADLNDDDDIAGNDDLSRLDPTPSSKDTAEIVNLLSNLVINDTIAQHMYGGSISQLGGNTLYSGLDVQVTSPNTDTQPVIIQDDAIITDYWKNAFMPDSIAGKVRILIKTREDGVDIDGKRVRGALLENNYSYFFGGTTLGTATTALALFASPDGNNQTALATLAGAPYNTVTQTEGLQLIDFNNGNGATQYGYEYGYGTATSLQAYERSKYIQARGTAETLFGRNAQLFIGFNMNFAYDAESANLTQSEVMYWGMTATYTGQVTSFTVGEVITFSGGGRGRLLYQNDAGATGTLVLAMEPGITPAGAETMTGVSSGGDGTVGVVTGTASTPAGSFLAMAIDDAGTTGFLYGQLLTGLTPTNNQTLYGGTSNSTVDVNGAVSVRTINNQYMGVYTGTNFQTNFGIAIDPLNAILGDLNRNLADTQQGVPDNQQGVVGNLQEGDVVTVYPWDGSTLDANGDRAPFYAETTITATVTGGVSTTIAAAAIPDNTPSAGFLRLERDSDGNFDLIEYVSYSGLTYTLGGSTPTVPNTATSGNNLMRAFIDAVVAVAGPTQLSYTAVKGAGNTNVAIKVRNGGTLNGPIKPNPINATFGATGFNVNATRISDA